MQPRLSHQSAHREFVEAVRAFSDDPRANLERYLAASRALEESRVTASVRRAALAREAR